MGRRNGTWRELGWTRMSLLALAPAWIACGPAMEDGSWEEEELGEVQEAAQCAMTHKSQYDGSTCQNDNCGMAAMAMMRQAMTCGACNTSGGTVRSWFNDWFGYTGCGGGLIVDGVTFMKNIYRYDGCANYTIEGRIGSNVISAADFRARLAPAGGWVATVNGNNANNPKPCSGFKGGHGIYVHRYHSNGTYEVYDPDCKAGRNNGYDQTSPKYWTAAQLEGYGRYYSGTNFTFANSGWVSATMGKGVQVDGSSSTPSGSTSYPGDITALGKCADVASSSTADLTKIQTWTCNGTNAQDWRITASRELRNSVANKCLDVSGAGTAAGTKLIQYTCHGANNQKWKFENMEIVASSGKCLDVPQGNWVSGQDVKLYTCNDTSSQKFTYDPATKEFRGLNGMCLDVSSSSTANGTAVQIWPCNGTTAQKWVQGRGGFTTLLAKDSKCLDVSGGSTTNGAKLQLWTCNDTAAQKWALRGAIKGVASGRCVDIPSSSATNGNQLQIWTCNDTAAQTWTIWSP